MSHPSISLSCFSVYKKQVLPFLNSLTLALLLVFMVLEKFQPVVNLIYLVCLISLPFVIAKNSDLFSRYKFLFVSVGVFVLYHEVQQYLLTGELSKEYVKYIALALYFGSLCAYGFCRITLYVATIIGSLLAAGMAMAAYLKTGGRIGLGFNPNVLGLILAALSAINLACFFQEESRLRHVFIFSFFMVALATLTTGSRNVWLIEMFLTAVLLFCFFYKLKLAGKAVLILASAIGVVTLATSGVVEKRIESTQHEINQIRQGNLNTSLGYRVQMLDMGVELFRLSPFYGVGKDPATRLELLQPVMDEKGYTEHAITGYDHLHNGFLDELASFGVLGLGAYLLLLAGIMRTAFQLRTALVTGCLLSVYLLGSIGDSPLNNSRPEILLILLVPLVLNMTKGNMFSKVADKAEAGA